LALTGILCSGALLRATLERREVSKMTKCNITIEVEIGGTTAAKVEELTQNYLEQLKGVGCTITESTVSTGAWNTQELKAA
jgi:hypothetical protein